MTNFILNITSPNDELMISSQEIQCYTLNSDMDFGALKDITSKLLKAEKIVLLHGNKTLELCKNLRADGIIVDLTSSKNIKKDIETIRQKSGDMTLGIICRNRRHEAMIVSENEPDFIIFKVWHDGQDKTIELAKWYNEFFLLQMAIMPQDDDIAFEEYLADIMILTPETYKIFVAKK